MYTHKKLTQAGVALIMTLLLLVVLVVVIGQFSYSIQIDAYIAQNSNNVLQVRYALASAVNFAIAELQLDAMQEAKSKNKYDSNNDEWANAMWSAQKPQQIGNVSVYYTITDESAKFNLMALIQKKQSKSNKKDKDKQKKRQR